MSYNLIITDQAEDELERLIIYLLEHLNNKQAAQHFLENVKNLYERMEENPFLVS